MHNAREMHGDASRQLPCDRFALTVVYWHLNLRRSEEAQFEAGTSYRHPKSFLTSTGGSSQIGLDPSAFLHSALHLGQKSAIIPSRGVEVGHEDDTCDILFSCDMLGYPRVTMPG